MEAGRQLQLYSEEVLENASVRTRAGKIVQSTEELIPGQDIYIVPDGHWFFYPALYVGFKIEVNLENDFNCTLEVKSVKPRLFTIDNFLTEEEMEGLKEYGKDNFEVSDTVINGKRSKSDVRVSETAWVPPELPHAYSFNSRVAQLAGIPLDLGLEDQIQVLRYSVGGHYHAHYDALPIRMAGGNPAALNGTQRLLTVFCYLNDVSKGGQTNFPYGGGQEYNPYPVERIQSYSDCSRGISITPKKGSVILWYNLLAETHMEGELDRYSLHGGCDVEEGEKWAANKWLYNKKYHNGLWGI